MLLFSVRPTEWRSYRNNRIASTVEPSTTSSPACLELPLLEITFVSHTPTMSDPRVVCVPMKVQAYVNYGSAQRYNQRQSEPTAYLAPTPQPNFTSLQLENSLIQQHDIFESIRRRPYRTSQDRTRLFPSRRGVTISWTLPKTVRYISYRYWRVLLK